MCLARPALLTAVGILLAWQPAVAQPVVQSQVPRVVNLSGVFRPADGQATGAAETVTLSIYSDEIGGAPLWQETQAVRIGPDGRYNLLLGETLPDGIPMDVFASGDARWLGMLWSRPGEAEGSRLRLTSVPYALRSADADTLGGKPASAYLLAPSGDGDLTRSAESGTAAATSATASQAAAILPGTINLLAKYVSEVDLGPSALYDSGGTVGVNTPSPFDALHVRFTNTNGGMTGYAVQNLGSSATSYSGMLFYDQNGALGQFQGFNNTTHEYRINNIARVSPGGAFNGSINFMTGSTSRFIVASNGNIGIGTTTPSALLEVSNAVPGGPANMWMTSYTNAFNPYYMARRARGTSGASTAVQNGDGLAGFYGEGYGTTAFGPGFAGGMTVQAAQNWTNTAHGTALTFSTTPINSTSSATRMTLDASGNLGIGTTNPNAPLEIVRNGETTVIGTSYNDDDGSAVFFRRARGTQQTPAAVQAGDSLGYFGAAGYGATDWGEGVGVMAVIAAENWTDTANGSTVAFATTPLGTTDFVPQVAILPNGSVGLGTPGDANGIPTATDRLQVFGDIRVGTTGTNGCLKRFDGTALAGTCFSDRFFKKDITPFAPVLDRFTNLQPVHYYWRAEDFPSRHFGNTRSYGLIAQDVEPVLPELVATDSDGYKAVDYSKLPLLTVQAIKELTAKNDALQKRVDELEPLKERVLELERLLSEMIAAKSRQ